MSPGDDAQTAPGGRTERYPPFGEAVGFLLSQLGAAVAQEFSSSMAELGLEPRHFALLRSIVAHEGESQSALAEHLSIPPSSMVAIVDQLEERGLVERRVHVSDRRARTLHLTDAGDDVVQRATELAMELESTVCRGLSDEQRSDVIERLHRIGANVGVTRGVHPGLQSDSA